MLKNLYSKKNKRAENKILKYFSGPHYYIEVIKMKYKYSTLEELVAFANSISFNQAAACRKWGLNTRTLYNILHGCAGNITFSNYEKFVGLCNELWEMKLRSKDK